MLKPLLNGFALFALATFNLAFAQDLPNIELPNKISASNVLILAKQGNSLSQKIAQYYAQQRHVPSAQIVSISLPDATDTLSPEEFSMLIQQLAPNLTANIKVILLTFDAPYRVGCMSITSAFALGYDQKYCGRKPSNKGQCHQTAISPYFNNQSSVLWQKDSPMRLSMMLSADTFQQAKAVIDRGIAADNSYPKGHAYLVKTHDQARSSRALIFNRFAKLWQQKGAINAHFIDDSDKMTITSIKNKKDILFYHTGLKHVPDIGTNVYLPGAVADHLTSGGGAGISHQGQMKAFRWLENGVTASYGAVTEPCNFTEKFPNPQVLIPNYVRGDSLIEAYWKSVQQPGEGLFIGEPLARPWGKTILSFQGKTLLIRSNELRPNQQYRIKERNALAEQWIETPDGVSAITHKDHLEIRIPNATAPYYQISKQSFYPGIMNRLN